MLVTYLAKSIKRARFESHARLSPLEWIYQLFSQFFSGGGSRHNDRKEQGAAS